MDAIIPQINEIQELFATAGQANVFETVQFPNIVVVGEQSAGKSSVLEGIVGQDFLPRGIDMVTRTPLVIQLNHVTKEDPKRKREPKPIAGDWVEFSHKRGEIFEDFKKVREEIETQTVKLAGDGKNISNEAIVLKLFSSRVVNLSLVDLPGLVKNPYPDQPLDIEEQIRNLVLEYITNPNSIILAITPATQDLAASESLKIASQVDKDGHRILAVLTKLDRMDNGTNASEILTKRVQLPRNIKLGMIGVVNRSQQDIQDGKALSAQLNTEKEFLFKHYPGICHQNGVPFLTKTLNELLMKHISACLPPLQQRLETMKSQYENQVTSFDKPVNNKEETMLSIITEFCKEFEKAIDGWATKDKEQAGYRIGYLFAHVLSEKLNSADPMENLSPRQLLNAIHNSTGTYFNPFFIQEKTYRQLLEEPIQNLEISCLDIYERVYEELLKAVEDICNKLKQKHARFLRLINAIHDVASNVILGLRQPTEYFVKGVVSNELFTNNNHPDFRTEELETFLNERFVDGNEEIKLIENVTNSNELAKHPKTSIGSFNPAETDHLNGQQNGFVKKPSKLNGFRKNLKSKLKMHNGHSSQHDSFTKLDEDDGTDNNDDVSIQSHDNISTNTYPIAQELSENEQISYLKTVYLIKRYFKVVIKTLQDSIPKTILRLLVYSANDKLHDDLVRDLYPHRVDELMADSPEMMAYKEDVMNKTEVMKEAISKIQKMRETPSNEIIPKMVKSL